MKTLLLLVFLTYSVHLTAQITSAQVVAGFGVDADLRANAYNNFWISGNDDWFIKDAGTGQRVIDTTGAAMINALYASDVSPYPYRMSSFFRGMSRPSYSIVNNRLWLDALFVRDYHGTDTTVFTAGSDKNGMSPQFWSGGIQSVPDKNDILDMFMHVRRAGPNTTDSLWFFGGLSLDQVTGNRYFDFEMYQTDIYYDRASGTWFGYGPDAGHTSWQFDAAGNVTRPGDIIFSAEYQSSALTNIEARIWIDKASLSVTPSAFAWSGQFDGASSGAQYGYASILPKNGGTFYSGLQSKNGEWPGTFTLVRQDNSLATTYSANQFMEFSVNLTKLGLDPVTTFGSDVCGTPFNRIVVKTRASASFTSELKDFVAPIDLFLAPRVNVLADAPVLCATQAVSNITVQNPSSSSNYTWSTTDGNIVGSTTGTSVTVDQPGTYIVTQRLSAGCNPYAYDTLSIVYDATCQVLASMVPTLRGSISEERTVLSWTSNANNQMDYFDVERSIDGVHYVTAGTVAADNRSNPFGSYTFGEDISRINAPVVYYRLKVTTTTKARYYSSVVRINIPLQAHEAQIYPNPAKDVVQVAVSSSTRQELRMHIFDFTGALIESRTMMVNQGTNVFSVDTNRWKPGAYTVQLVMPTQTINKKLVREAQ